MSQLLQNIIQLINQNKQQLTLEVNNTLALLEWQVGKHINETIQQYKQVASKQEIITAFSKHLCLHYGQSFDAKNLKRMLQFAKDFSLPEIATNTPSLIYTFKDPYFLDFLGLKDGYLETDLEAAILKELELFILELGIGFTFVARQKRIIIDGEDFYLDLLFYHRKLRRLVAIKLKIGKFKAAYKGQMELYLK